MSKMDMEVMSLKKEHIQAVMELLDEGKPYVLAHHNYVYWIMEEYFPSSNFVVSTENKVIGFICALPSLDKQSYFIWQIVVDEEYRGKKVATLLVDRIIQEAKLRGYHTLELTINGENQASYNLFKRIAEEQGSEIKHIGEYTYKGISEFVYSIEL